jgi:hypothetical protein
VILPWFDRVPKAEQGIYEVAERLTIHYRTDLPFTFDQANFILELHSAGTRLVKSNQMPFYWEYVDFYSKICTLKNIKINYN